MKKSKTDKGKTAVSTTENEAALTEKINSIKESVLKFVPAKYIYLFGSYAYGNPTEESDMDIHVVTPDNINSLSELYAKIIGDLGDKKIFFIDFLLGRETSFNTRKENNLFEKTICQKGKLLYGQ
ncbi:MAG: nucleotidyltransferase domain-containing protein [Tannerella sp.]|nr:nucleotidyltransferase domain-containing protein [Tannerella sp.]